VHLFPLTDRVGESLSIAGKEAGSREHEENFMKPKKANFQDDLERWENEGGSTSARRLQVERRTDPDLAGRRIPQPAHRTLVGMWGMCSRLLEGVGQMFGIRRHPAR
jgi:hypothetical protein